jgi:alanine-synthesizing transaminase
MSKSYNMAGWRVGFMVGNRDLVNALGRIKGYHDYGTFTPIQVAAIAALDGPQECVNEIAMKYQARRDVLVKGLHEAGWMVDNPKASMYVWAKIPEPIARAARSSSRSSCWRGEGVGVAGHRLRRVRRRLRALRDDRERARTRQAIRGIKEMFRDDGLRASAARGSASDAQRDTRC